MVFRAEKMGETAANENGEVRKKAAYEDGEQILVAAVCRKSLLSGSTQKTTHDLYQYFTS